MKRSVIGIVFEEQANEKKVLLVQRRDVPVWVLPGGGVEENETPEEAVVREILEETGIQTVVRRKTGEYTPINKLSHYTEVFECQKVGGALCTTDESRSVSYWSRSQLPSTFFFLHQDWLDDAAQTSSKDIVKKTIYQITYTNLGLYFCKHPLHVLRFLCSRLGFPLNSRKRDV